jgi:CRP-like cAMP-binding protein
VAEALEPSADGEAAVLTTIEKLLFLREVPVFRSVTVENLRPLADSFTIRRFDAGERIFGYGDDSDALYVIVSGQVAIEREEEGVRLAELGPRQAFGDMGLVSDDPRSASAIATEESTLLVLERGAFLRHSAREPQILRGVIHALGARIREVDAARLEAARAARR